MDDNGTVMDESWPYHTHKNSKWIGEDYRNGKAAQTNADHKEREGEREEKMREKEPHRTALVTVRLNSVDWWHSSHCLFAEFLNIAVPDAPGTGQLWIWWEGPSEQHSQTPSTVRHCVYFPRDPLYKNTKKEPIEMWVATLHSVNHIANRTQQRHQKWEQKGVRSAVSIPADAGLSQKGHQRQRGWFIWQSNIKCNAINRGQIWVDNNKMGCICHLRPRHNPTNPHRVQVLCRHTNPLKIVHENTSNIGYRWMRDMEISADKVVRIDNAKYGLSRENRSEWSGVQ